MPPALMGSALVLSALVLSALVLAPVTAGAAAPVPAASRFTAQPASGIVAQARASMASAGSVTATGTGTVAVAGIGTVTVTERDYSGPTSGTQVVQMTSDHPTRPALPAASTVDVDGDLYTDANRSFWSSTAGVTPAAAAVLAGRWVQIPSDSPLYSQVGADLTMASLLQDLFHAHQYHRGGLQQVDGVPSITVTYVNSGGDAGPATSAIAVSGKHLPVSVTLGGLTFRLHWWGRTRVVSPPDRSVPLVRLWPSAVTGAGSDI